jgi:hypothetical protein
MEKGSLAIMINGRIDFRKAMDTATLAPKDTGFSGKVDRINRRKRSIPETLAFVLQFFLLNFIAFGVEPANLPAQAEEKTGNPAPIPRDELGPPPGTYQILSENGKVAIPFEMYRGKIRMLARVNGHDCRLSIDNGSLWDELLFFGSPQVDGLSLNKTGETSIARTKADLASPVTVAFKDVVFLGQTAIITRYDRVGPNIWEGMDGQVSATFFKHFVVRIDFDASLIELLPPRAFTYSGQGQALTMKTGPFNSRTVAAEIVMPNGSAVALDLLIDLGGIYPLYLPLGKDDKIALPQNSIAATLGSGLQTQKGYLGKVKTVRLGKYVVDDVPTAFTPVDKGADIYGNTMLGLPLLQRFNVTFDYFRQRIILEPSKSYHDPFPSPMIGTKGGLSKTEPEAAHH